MRPSVGKFFARKHLYKKVPLGYKGDFFNTYLRKRPFKGERCDGKSFTKWH